MWEGNLALCSSEVGERDWVERGGVVQIQQWLLGLEERAGSYDKVPEEFAELLMGAAGVFSEVGAAKHPAP